MAGASQVLSVAQMVAAEQALIERGESVESLMERAGAGAAEWVWRVAAGRPATVLCGPGNNGGDGYVIARELARRGLEVSVVAPLEPGTDAAIAARKAWGGTVAERGQGGVLVDALFGSGLARPLSGELAALLGEEAARHAYRVAIDLPSGIDADAGRALNGGLPGYDLTLALGAWKFAHWTMPAMAAMGERRLVPIGVAETPGAARLLERPRLESPARDAHKYSRGMVLVVGGPMEGAELLASEGAMRSGAGTVRLAAKALHTAAPPDLVLKPQPLAELLTDERTGAVLVGPGLGREEDARAKLAAVLAAGWPAVIDADALHLLAPADLERFAAPLILTPHEGEMRRLCESFGIAAEGKLEQARALAAAARAVVVAKGPDTVIAAPGGRTALAPSPSSWLSVAGTGDVLAGVAAGRLAAHGDPFDSACEAVWLHGEAARLTPAPFTASELARRVAAAYASAL
jgi:ADP-dependent NAD(P)H-hydrate dehydratase / NAD(P)H-hydrate epimerase